MCSISQNDPAAGGDFKCAQGGCQACLDALIREHTGLIRTIVRRVKYGGVPYDDLIQAGRLALWRAVKGFDPHRGVQFSTYGGLAIERALWREVRLARRSQRCYPELPQAEPWTWVSWEMREALIATVKRLPERLRVIMTALYGLDGQLPKTLTAVGQAQGVSQERIRQLREQALTLLRHPGFSRQLYQVCEQDTRESYQQALRATRARQRRVRR
jgi:RNA polymerase sigma factor (sigma-70 family)